uniref:DNA primase large subunit-like isoform X1 n=1 Tax=Halichoerus grypus TaxID=9711 RepID=UPI001659CF2B|nr:DNA primase large subunit-like isoform X1 [Halichoerus grypus]
MQFSGGKRKKLRLTGDQKNVCYPHSLQFYLEPPSESISLIEFENLAIDRVKLLKAVENLGVSYVKGTEPYQSKLENEIRKLKFSFRENLENEYEPRRKDHISHFILRLAYCQSEDLRRWFIQQEMDLLRFRFSILPKDKIQNFLKDSHLHFEAVSIVLYPSSNCFHHSPFLLAFSASINVWHSFSLRFLLKYLCERIAVGFAQGTFPFP